MQSLTNVHDTWQKEKQVIMAGPLVRSNCHVKRLRVANCNGLERERKPVRVDRPIGTPAERRRQGIAVDGRAIVHRARRDTNTTRALALACSEVMEGTA